MEYNELSDFEINKAVAEALGLDVLAPMHHNADVVSFRSGQASPRSGRNIIDCADYCNNPSDAWPIIAENKIDFEWLGASVEASDITGKHCNEDLNNNALRACMIVYLKLKEQS